MQEEYLIAWEAPEFKHYHKNLGWYVTLVATTILISGFLVIQKDIFGAITIAIIGMFIIYFARLSPSMIDIKLSPKGLHLQDLHIPYKNMRHFWLVEDENHRTLNIETIAKFNHIVIVELADQDPEEVRTILLNFLPEHENSEPTLAQKVMHMFKF